LKELLADKVITAVESWMWLLN